MTYTGWECTCSLTPGGKIASSTRTRSFSNRTRIVLEFTTAGSCAYAACGRKPSDTATATRKMIKIRLRIPQTLRNHLKVTETLIEALQSTEAQFWIRRG